MEKNCKYNKKKKEDVVVVSEENKIEEVNVIE